MSQNPAKPAICANSWHAVRCASCNADYACKPVPAGDSEANPGEQIAFACPSCGAYQPYMYEAAVNSITSKAHMKAVIVTVLATAVIEAPLLMCVLAYGDSKSLALYMGTVTFISILPVLAVISMRNKFKPQDVNAPKLKEERLAKPLPNVLLRDSFEYMADHLPEPARSEALASAKWQRG